MKLLEARGRWGLWLLEFGIGATALYFMAMSVIHSFLTADQSAAKGELDFGCTTGLAAIALGGFLLTTRKR